MAATGTELRNLLALEVSIKRQEGFYTHNDFMVEQVWVPEEELENLAKSYPGVKLYVITSPWEEGPNQTRCSGLALREVPISFGFQKAQVLTSDVAGIDLLVDLIDELYDVCRHFDHRDYSWIRTEALKDENGVPFNYTNLINHNVFEAYFTVYYNHVVQ